MEFLKGKKVLVTGGCGFIGSNLVLRLLSEGVSVVRVIDDLRTGSEKNIPLYEERVDLWRYPVETLSSARLTHFLKGVEYVFHLAEEKHRNGSSRPSRLLKSNIQGTHSLLAAAVEGEVKKIVFASSFDVYGRSMAVPAKEMEKPAPHTLYGVTKLACEQLLDYFHTAQSLPYVALRPFWVYGPRQTDHPGYRSLVASNFKRLISGRKLLVPGSGKQKFDYVYVDDVVDALCMAAGSSLSEGVFNVGSGKGVAVEKMVSFIKRASKRDVEIHYGPAAENEEAHRIADISCIESALGWKPSVDLAQGLSKTYEWLEGRMTTTSSLMYG